MVSAACSKEDTAMSSRMFQSVIQQMKEASDRVIGVIDCDGNVIAATDPACLGDKWEEVSHRLNMSSEPIITVEGRTCKALQSWSARYDYAVFVNGEDEAARALCVMAAVALNGAKASYEEKHDRGTFVKNIITDNILPGDIYIHAKELHFVTDVPRAVFLIRQVSSKVDVAAMDILQNMFAEKQQDFVLSINETDIVLVKQVSAGVDGKELYKIAQNIEETLSTELFVKTVIGIGTVASHVRELADSYKEAQTAIEVGKVFDTEKSIINYENLGLGRLIYQLPTTLCEIFLSEVFKKNSIDALDQETLFTINKFFENNLNVSETSRKLFVHRNTLVYRLEKIKKITGLDLREFDHAIIFKVALMVKKYLDSRTNPMH